MAHYSAALQSTLSAAAAFVCVLAVCGSNDAFAKDVERVAKSGKVTRMYVYRAWNRDCESNPGVVKVHTKPLNGKLASSSMEVKIGVSRFDPERTGHCKGKPIVGLRVDYQSNPGFRGVDLFQIEVTFNRRPPIVDKFKVTVN